MPGKRAKRAKRRVESGASGAHRQARGTVRNGRQLVGSFTFDQILPNAVTGFLSELIMLIPYALGRSTTQKQVFASITLILLAVISTPFTLGYSLIVALPFVVTLSIGLWRLVPAVNSRFQSARGNRLRDRDIPLWKRD